MTPTDLKNSLTVYEESEDYDTMVDYAETCAYFESEE